MIEGDGVVNAGKELLERWTVLRRRRSCGASSGEVAETLASPAGSWVPLQKNSV